MRYTAVEEAVFRERPNRFIAHVETENGPAVAHVPNTGRCRELLLPGSRVLIQKSDREGRKTPYTLFAVWKGETLINLDSMAPNRVAEEALRDGTPPPGLTVPAAVIRREAVRGGSRFDFYVEGDGYRGYLEVKGVTLEEDGVARFPDAPTERGVKHLRELAVLKREGWYAGVLFVIQMKGVRWMEPNRRTHPAFAEALRYAAQAGVAVQARDCEVTREELRLNLPVEVII